MSTKKSLVENVFPIKIYQTNDRDLADRVIKNLLPIMESHWEEVKNNNQGSMRADGLCSYNVMRNLHHCREMEEFNFVLMQHLEIFWKELAYRNRPLIYEMWANRYGPGSWIDSHNHSPVILAATFYLDNDVSSGDFVLEHPLSNILKYQPFEKLNHRSEYSHLFDHAIPVSKGDLIIFPAWINHKSKINHGPGDRICIATNIIDDRPGFSPNWSGKVVD